MPKPDRSPGQLPWLSIAVQRRRLTASLAALVAGILVVAVITGLSGAADDGPASHETRSQRRLYTGAQPIIPHEPLSGKCVTCHTTEGTHRPPLGFAPANPHTKTVGLSADSRCRQCHVHRNTTEVFVENEFRRGALTRTGGTRAHAKAPPTIPHGLFMRTDCNACHSGPAARPEIRCSHPERSRCVQCHVPQTSAPLRSAKEPDPSLMDEGFAKAVANLKAAYSVGLGNPYFWRRASSTADRSFTVRARL